MSKRKFFDVTALDSLNIEYWSGYIRYSSKFHIIYKSKRKYYRVYSTLPHLHPLAIALKTAIHSHSKGYWIKVHKILPSTINPSDSYLRGILDAIGRLHADNQRLVLRHRYLEEFRELVFQYSRMLLPEATRTSAYALRIILNHKKSTQLLNLLKGEPYKSDNKFWSLINNS